MRILLTSCAVLLFLLISSCAMNDPQAGKLRHVVLFAFKEDATAAQIESVEQAALGLQDKIPEILAYEWGTNISVEDRAKGFTHCVFITFADAAARDVYLPHEAHQAFIKVAMPVLLDVLVVDYIAQH